MYIWYTDFITMFYFIFPSTDLYSMYMYMFYCIFYMYYVLLYVLHNWQVSNDLNKGVYKVIDENQNFLLRLNTFI